MKSWISRHVCDATMSITRFRLGIAVLIIVMICAVMPAVSETMATPVPAGGRQFTYGAFLRGARKGISAASFVLESLSSSNQFVLDHGTLSFVGRILPPPPQPAASFFPTRMRVSMVHQAETGQIISRRTFDLSVQSDGRILRQTFSFPDDIVIHSKERLVSSLIPLDAALPYCILNITAALTPPQIPIASTDMNLYPPPFPRPGILQAAFSISRAITVQAKGRETFHFKARLPGGRGFSWRSGALSTFGNLVPIAAGASFPSKVEMIIKHLNPGGQVLSVDSDVIQVMPSGTIPLQKFALSTIGPGRTPEELEISFVPLDAAVPAGQLEMKFSFSPQ